jgi:hypothetical protein
MMGHIQTNLKTGQQTTNLIFGPTKQKWVLEIEHNYQKQVANESKPT